MIAAPVRSVATKPCSRRSSELEPLLRPHLTTHSTHAVYDKSGRATEQYTFELNYNTTTSGGIGLTSNGNTCDGLQ
jgi:hypothetical protein